MATSVIKLPPISNLEGVSSKLNNVKPADGPAKPVKKSTESPPLIPTDYRPVEQEKDITYYLEHETLDDTIQDADFPDFQFEELYEFTASEDEIEEDLDTAIKSINEKRFLAAPTEVSEKPTEINASLEKYPEIITDFFTNYLAKKGLHRTLETFHTEWFEFKHTGKLNDENEELVSDLYRKNQFLEDTAESLRSEVDKFREMANKARATYDKLRKERDFHRMHHKRVVQEKNKLIGDIKRLKKHYESYESTWDIVQTRYKNAMKEKTLTRMEKDRLVEKVDQLEQALANLKVGVGKQNSEKKSANKKKSSVSDSQVVKDSTVALDDVKNPFAETMPNRADVEHFTQKLNISAHDQTVSCLKIHQNEKIIATGSDDGKWKIWNVSSGDLGMVGEGHTEWISDCDFHPFKNILATGSGDSTIKLWNLSKNTCAATLSEHIYAVWGVAFHYSGDYLASGSMDNTAKFWDLSTKKCKTTFRGHKDSVNSVTWQPFSNILATASADKTISTWDARTGLCAQTLYGHLNAVNHVTYSLKGDKIASCDADGVVKLWDLRNLSETASIALGPYSANKLAFDPSGEIIAVACENSSCKILDLKNNVRLNDIPVESGGAQSLEFNRSGTNLAVASSKLLYLFS